METYMPTVPPPVVRAVGDGSRTDFEFAFTYIDADYVKVTVDGVDTPFTFVNAQTVRVTPAPATGTQVWVYRETPQTNLVVFPNGNPVPASDLNLLTRQIMHVAQEAYSRADTTAIFNLMNTAISISDAALAAAEDATEAASQLGTFHFPSFAAAQAWGATNTPLAGRLFTVRNRGVLVGSPGSTEIPGLPNFSPLQGDLDCFGDLTGTNAAIDTAIWQAAVDWAYPRRASIKPPNNASSVISGLVLRSFVRIIRSNHTVRGKAPVVFQGPPGAQLYGASMGGIHVVNDTPADVAATVLKLDNGIVQNCDFSRMKISGFQDAETIVLGCAPVTQPFDHIDWPFASTNTIYNDFSFVEIVKARIALRLSGEYGTPTGSEPAGHSPAPRAVVTKNLFFGFKAWDVSEVGFWFHRCCDSENFYDADIYLKNNGIFCQFGDGVFTEQNYVNSMWIKLTAAVAEPATTAATLLRFLSWSFGNHVMVEHDINYFTNVITLIDQAGVTRRCTPRILGKGVDPSTGNTATFDMGPAHWLRIAAGSVADPSHSFYDESNSGMFLHASGILGFSTLGNLSALLDGNGFALPNGILGQPAVRFINDSDTGFSLLADGVIGFISGGATKATVNANGLNTIDGTLTAPSQAFISEPGLGFYRQSAGTIGLASGGVLGVALTATGVVAASGTTTAPGFRFISDTDCGMRLVGANSVGLVVGGSDRIGITSTAINLNLTTTITGGLTVTTTTAGLLLPRLTTAQETALGAVAAGTLIYNTDLGAARIRTASAWVSL